MPQLLDQLNDPESGESALDGLKQVMAVKSRVVLPFLVPKVGNCRSWALEDILPQLWDLVNDPESVKSALNRKY